MKRTIKLIKDDGTQWGENLVALPLKGSQMLGYQALRISVHEIYDLPITEEEMVYNLTNGELRIVGHTATIITSTVADLYQARKEIDQLRKVTVCDLGASGPSDLDNDHIADNLTRLIDRVADQSVKTAFLAGFNAVSCQANVLVAKVKDSYLKGDFFGRRGKAMKEMHRLVDNYCLKFGENYKAAVEQIEPGVSFDAETSEAVNQLVASMRDKILAAAEAEAQGALKANGTGMTTCTSCDGLLAGYPYSDCKRPGDHLMAQGPGSADPEGVPIGQHGCSDDQMLVKDKVEEFGPGSICTSCGNISDSFPGMGCRDLGFHSISHPSTEPSPYPTPRPPITPINPAQDDMIEVDDEPFVLVGPGQIGESPTPEALSFSRQTALRSIPRSRT